ncbi:Protein of unknown function DUF2911 [Gemmatirosa kalamazoonensis]|uniref:DUF2911 domain-containing protein n=1 Tax=Gemmatirosa kalamazoonensis TaxID=861299 RepID=W0RD53_9BACT|nr:DUF2911 domain-containing protein [Gemmatirosa kalamazoonensis]AHG89054.1 Protein of unknown function DUF2911 [Gemmatirosa kalamazoonensis]
MRLALLPALALVAGPLAAQQRVSKDASAAGGAFVVRLGSDTVAVERYARIGNRVEGDVVNRAPTVRVTHYVVELDPAGRVTRAQFASRRPDGSLVPNTAKSATISFRGDSAYSEILTAADTTVRLAARVPAGTVPGLANSYAMQELALMQLRASRAPSGSLSQYSAGAQGVNPLKVTIAGNRATLDYFGDPIVMTTDAAGRLLAVDGTASTNKIVVERVATVDVPTLATAFAARGNMGQTSPRDTVRAAAAGAQLWIDYGRPSVRGRTVWGGLLVPYNAVWRTGANAATQLSTSADLMIGGATVPAGKYTLWTYAAPDGYQLVVNKQTGQWGTEYKADQDLVRIPLTAAPLASPVEQFTFAIDPTPDGGTIRMLWGDKQLSVPFVVKK